MYFHTRVRTGLGGRYVGGGVLVYTELPRGGEPRLYSTLIYGGSDPKLPQVVSIC